MKKYRKIFYLIILSILLFPLTVLADNGVILNASQNTLTIGDEVTIDATIPNNDKVYVLTAKLNYDHNVFEELTTEDFLGLEDVTEIVYNPENNKFGLINKAGENTNKLFSIHLRVKKNATVGQTNITLTNIQTSDGQNATDYEKSNLEILITRDATTDEELPTNSPEEYTDTKIASEHVFSNRPLVIVISIISAILIGCLIFLIIRKKDKKITLIVGGTLIACAIALTTIIILNSNRQDINNDGHKDYNDAKEILEYLIDLKQEPADDNTEIENNENQESNTTTKPHKPSKPHYDYNNDGKIDINDAGESTENTTNKTNYQVTLRSNETNDNLYTEKGTITLEFKATVNPNEIIKEVMVDGTYYPVTKHDNYYTVTLNTPTTSGIHKFEFTKVKLVNNREINTELTIVKEVLKDEPYVDMFNFDEKNDVLTFKLEDKEDAFIKGKIVIEDQNNKEIISQELQEENRLEYEFERQVPYNVFIFATYDRDTNTLNNITGSKNYYDNKIIYSHLLSLDTNYDFTISDVTITDAIEKGSKPVIEFTSTNSKGYSVEYIEINNIRYPVSPKYEKNRYTVELNDLNTNDFGKYYLDIAKVEINNYKVFTKDIDYSLNQLSYTVLKNAPSVDDIILENDSDNEQLYINYHVKDADKTLQHLNISLIDANNNLVNTLSDVQNGMRIPISYAGNLAGGYRVKFLADYNLGTDRHTYTEVNVGEKSITTQTAVRITKVEVGKLDNNNRFVLTPYAKKSEKKYQVRVTVTIDEELRKKYNRIAGFTINGLNYDGGSNTVNNNGEGSTTISFTVPSEAGLKTLRIDRVKLAVESYQGVSQAFFAVEPVETQIDVLKDVPTIKDLKITNEDYSKGEVTFRFNVASESDSFTSGTITLKDQTKEITEGLNTITFTNVPTEEELPLIFKGNYDLDTNSIEGTDPKLNYYEDTLIYETTYGLYDDTKYQELSFTNLSTISDNSDNYFEKNERINLSFQISSELNLNIAKIIVEGKEYEVEKTDSGYRTLLEGYNTSGVKEITITDLILTNGKKITLTEKVSTNIEVLKDNVSIYDFKFAENEQDITITLNLKDHDNAIPDKYDENLLVNIYDEDNQLLHSYPFSKTITLLKDGNIRYYIKVIANYDRDIKKGEDNYYTNVELLNEVISLDKNYLEMKKISSITLYKDTLEEITEVDTLTSSEIIAHPENYFVKITMQNLPTVHAKIKKVLIEDNHLILILDYEYVITEKNSEKQDLRIDFGIINEDGTVTNTTTPSSIEEIINIITNNPNANITLTQSIDLANVNIASDYIFDVEYHGTFNGNGYTIKNINKPLFKSLKGATIKNLRLNKVRLDNPEYKGTLANVADSSVISNVYINDYKNTNISSSSGGLIGTAKSNTIIDKTRINNLEIKSTTTSQEIGGLVGILTDSKLTNSYINNGSITADSNYVGALVGNATSSTISNTVSNVSIIGGDITCSLACSKSKTSIIKNNVVLNSKNYANFVNNASSMSNNYRLTDEILPKEEGVEDLPTNALNPELFRRAQFDEKIWHIKDVIYTRCPIFVSETSSVLDLDTLPDDYDAEKEYYLYSNLMLLTPFYDSNKIIANGKNISSDSLLATAYIKHILPLDENGNIVTYLTTNNVNKIQKLKLVYDNNEVEEYDVRFDKVYDMVASYRISSLKIDYTFNHYIIDSNSQLVNNLTNYLASLDYDNNLDILTPGTDSRILKEFYNDVTKKELNEFILKYISVNEYNITNQNEAIADYFEREIKNDPEFIRTLYVYNYFRRFYDVDIDGLKLYDLILFNSTGFAEEMTTTNIVEAYLKDSKNFETNRTSDVYGNLLGKYTNYGNIPLFLEYLVTTLTDEEPADWFANEFKGYLVELDVPNRDDIQYRLWDHIKNKDKNTNVTWYNYALPILTLPERSAYIITTPGQFVIGAERTYINDPFNEAEQADFQARVAKYATRMKDYYTVTAALIEDANIFNNIHTIQIDKRFAYQNGILTYQNPYSTEEPFHKNFNEVIGQWAYPDGNAATANGAYIIWRAEGCLDGEWTYSTWSHETAHNMDARLFLKDNGRRFDAGGEDYADGNLTQSFGEHDIVMNLSMHFNANSRIATNLDPSRIDSKEKIQDFYSKLFDTLYIMDYIEGQAFLDLTPEEQAMLVVQVSYPREEKNTLPGHEYLQRQHTFYSEVTVEQIKEMNLQTMDDLYNNKLVIYPGVIASTITTNRYGGENISKVRWYQPHNDEGRPDSYSIKWLAYEMLGYAGYDNGYIAYYSNINSEQRRIPNVASDGVSYAYDSNGNQLYSNVNYKTDLMALQQITNDETMTFQKYRQNRFNKVKDNLSYIQIIDVNAYYLKFYNALKADAAAVKAKKDEALEKYPGDSEEEVKNRNTYINNSKVKNFTNSTKVRDDLYYEMKIGTNEFYNNVYDQNIPHTVTPFVKPEDN